MKQLHSEEQTELTSTQEQIKKDHKLARLSKNSVLAGILGCLLGEVSIVGKNVGNRETTDDEAQEVIRKFRKDAIVTRDEVIKKDPKNSTTLQKIDYEIETYESYLPQQMANDALRAKILGFIAGSEKVNKGMIMGWLSKNFKGLYDGKTASGIVDDALKEMSNV